MKSFSKILRALFLAQFTVALCAQDATDLSKRDTFASMLRFAGKVLLEGSVPPPEPIRVELRCNDRFVYQAMTGANGSFSLGVGGGTNSEGAMDASVSGTEVEGLTAPSNRGDRAGIRAIGLGQVDLRGCEIRAETLSGFSSTPIALGVRSVLDNPDVGIILLRRSEDGLGTSVSLNSLQAPPKARQLYLRARQDLSDQQPDLKKAQQRLEEALKVYPEFAAASNLLGELHNRAGRVAEARVYFSRSLQADPQFLDPHTSLLDIESAAERWDEVGNLAEKLVRLDPQSPKNAYYLGLSRYQMSRFEEASLAFSRVYELGAEREFPMAVCLLGMIEWGNGEFQSAAHRFVLFLELAPDAPGDLRTYVQTRLKEWESKGIRPQE